MKRIIVDVYNSRKPDDKLTKEFDSFRSALDYVFKELDKEMVELHRINTNKFVFILEDLDGHILKYQMTIIE